MVLPKPFQASGALVLLVGMWGGLATDRSFNIPLNGTWEHRDKGVWLEI